jgi:hypothetical protein
VPFSANLRDFSSIPFFSASFSLNSKPKKQFRFRGLWFQAAPLPSFVRTASLDGNDPALRVNLVPVIYSGTIRFAIIYLTQGNAHGLFGV